MVQDLNTGWYKTSILGGTRPPYWVVQDFYTGWYNTSILGGTRPQYWVVQDLHTGWYKTSILGGTRPPYWVVQDLNTGWYKTSILGGTRPPYWVVKRPPYWVVHGLHTGCTCTRHPYWAVKYLRIYKTSCLGGTRTPYWVGQNTILWWHKTSIPGWYKTSILDGTRPPYWVVQDLYFRWYKTSILGGTRPPCWVVQDIEPGWYKNNIYWVVPWSPYWVVQDLYTENKALLECRILSNWVHGTYINTGWYETFTSSGIKHLCWVTQWIHTTLTWWYRDQLGWYKTNWVGIRTDWVVQDRLGDCLDLKSKSIVVSRPSSALSLILYVIVGMDSGTGAIDVGHMCPVDTVCERCFKDESYQRSLGLQAPFSSYYYYFVPLHVICRCANQTRIGVFQTLSEALSQMGGCHRPSRCNLIFQPI